jgi:hypothetical protein
MKAQLKVPAFFFLLLMLPLLQACGGAGAWEGTIADSAGITVVHNTATPLWRSGEEWTATEDLRIGTVAGEPEYQFGALAFVEVGEDGTIYGMDLQATEGKAYDPDGNYLRTIGSPGGGPGELAPGAVFIFDDGAGGLIIPDLGNRRVNRYDMDGEPTGSFTIDLSAGVPMVWGVDPDGRLIAQIRGMNVQGIASLEEGDLIVVFDTAGVVADTLAVLPKGQMLEGITEEQFSLVLFSPEPVWDLGQDGSITYAMNDQYRILVNGPDGNLSRIITRDIPPKPVGESDKDAIFAALREQMSSLGLPAPQVEQFVQGVGFAENYPAFGLLFRGPEESIWVQRIRSAQDMAEGQEEGFEFDAQDIGSPEWEVFDSEGRYLGVVTLPDRFQPVNVKDNFLYGVWRDELDVQYIMRVRVDMGTA